MTKKIFLWTCAILLSYKSLAQTKTSSYFYVFVQEDETNWWCSTDLNISPSDSKTDLRFGLGLGIPLNF